VGTFISGNRGVRSVLFLRGTLAQWLRHQARLALGN
jgi:hypothetical protein